MQATRGELLKTDRKFFSTGQVAALCEVSIPTVHRWLKSGALPHFKLPGSTKVRIQREDLVRFMEVHGFRRAESRDDRIKILAVDDEPQVLEVLRRTFSDESRFDLRTASTGFEVGVLAATFPADVIVLDIRLPDIDGRQIVRTLHQHGTEKAPIVIGISGAIPEQESESLTSQGFDSFVRKPVSPQVLRNMVLEAFQARHR